MQKELPWQLKMFNKTLKKKTKINVLKRHLGDLHGKHCIMVTFGDNNGAMNFHLRTAGGTWTWAEFEEAGIKPIEELLNEPVAKVDISSCKMPFSDASFDCVVVIDCHEHLEDPVQLTRELWRITKPGGKVVVSVPNGDERMLVVKIKNLVGMTKEKYGHIVTGYDIPDLSKVLEDANLKVISSSSYSKFFTEMLELAINCAYVKVLSKKSKVKVGEGTIAPTTRIQLQSVEKSYRIYSLVYPFFWAISQLDRLLFFNRGYAVIVEAKR